MVRLWKALLERRYKSWAKPDAYLRDKGAICYKTPIFEPITGVPELLLSSGLTWIWESSPPFLDPKLASGYMPERSMTLLASETAPLLIADLEERDDDYGRAISIIGYDSDTSDLLLDPDRRHIALQEFDGLEKGPIRIILYQEVDSPSDYVFAPHSPVEQVAQLLDHWGISQGRIGDKFPYSYLRPIKLESLYGL
jgi:hypothetical protein